MSLLHAVGYNVGAVQARIENEAGPLWPDKRRDIAEAKYMMYRLLATWGQPGPAYNSARDRLCKEMEIEVDKVLLRSLHLHSDEERGLIAWMLWQRGSKAYKDVLKLLPGGESFFFCQPDKTLEEEIDFRVSKLPSLIAVDFDYELFERHRKRLKTPSLIGAVRSCRAVCASQRSSVPRSAVTLYFDNDENAVYARCLV